MKTTLKTAKFCAETAKWWCIFGVYMLDFLYFGCQGGEMVVRLRRILSWLRRFLCVIQMIAMFICGENMVRKRQNCGVFAACTCLISCIFVAKVAKWWCDVAFSWLSSVLFDLKMSKYVVETAKSYVEMPK